MYRPFAHVTELKLNPPGDGFRQYHVFKGSGGGQFAASKRGPGPKTIEQLQMSARTR